MSTTLPPTRLVSLDQFRGYTVLGMFLVNFVGSFDKIKEYLPVLKHHHTYCSYADTIMPQFFFAVGFALRLSFLRRLEQGSPVTAYWHTVVRCFALMLVAFVVYGSGFARDGWKEWNNRDQLARLFEIWWKREQFQTLTHIAVTTLLVLPVLAARPAVRLLFAIGCTVVHFVISYEWGYRWTNTQPNGVDGGPLGVLTWAIPLLAGTLAYDAWKHLGSTTKLVKRLAIWGSLIMVGTYLVSCVHLAPKDIDQRQFQITFSLIEPPLVYVDKKPPTNDLFTMSQRSGSFTYPLFCTGLSLVVMAFFVFVSDIKKWQLGIFRTLGSNALAAYIIHGIADNGVKAFMPKDAPLWYVFAGFGVFLLICYLLLRGMEKQKLFLRL